MNLIMLIGNLGRDPEMRTTNSGTDVASFGLATTERWKDGSGERKEQTTWHNCVVFGALSKVVEDWVHKGDKIMVSGRLSKRKYKGKDGNEREAVEVVVDKLELLGNRGESKGRGRDRDDEDEEEEEEQPRRKSAPKTKQKKGDQWIPDDLDDDIPF